MHTQDLIAKLAQDVGLTRVTSQAAIESIVDGVTRALAAGEPVTVAGLGAFKPVVRQARTGRNPATGAPLRIPKRTGVRFTPAAGLKKAVNR